MLFAFSSDTVRAFGALLTIGPRDCTERDVEAVCAVDRDDRQGQVREFLFIKLRAGLRVRLIGHMAVVINVTASVHAKAARSWSLENGDLHQALSR